MKIRPLHDRVLIEPAEEETKTAGGIFIPDTAKEKPARGKIVAVGNGAVGDDGKVRPMVVKKGDIVLYGKYAGSDVKVDGAEYKVMRESDILAVID